MSSKKKNLLQSILTPKAGSGCGRPKLSDVYEPAPKPKPKTSISKKNPNPKYCSSTTSCDKSVGFSLPDSEEEGSTSTTFTLKKDNNTSSTQNSESETDPKASRIMDSIAVVKDSDDPFQHFKNSMSQMILEKNIYSKDHLEELLNCFLELNSPCQHDVIVQAFTEIWKEIRRVSHES
ncbi:hypothetical protein POTOM_016244 [Populus tomentosa]|uniref:Transcription repressor n=1 Tax=Populus tomentosa TaxID=118781 RepID=A0A8X7ZZC0_POPTO|nr:hypothetical protein POTOM_016244 [Populus tomentosa]